MMNKMKGIVAIVVVLWGMLFALPLLYSEEANKEIKYPDWWLAYNKSEEKKYRDYLLSKTPANGEFHYYDDIYDPNKIIATKKEESPKCKGHFDTYISTKRRAGQVINAGEIDYESSDKMYMYLATNNDILKRINKMNEYLEKRSRNKN